MTQVLAWQRGAPAQDVLRQAAEALRAGQLVALPTEAGYVVAASGDAMARLAASQHEPPTLALGDPCDVYSWVADLRPLGRRLVFRCWPGPITLAFSVQPNHSGLAGLSEPVRRRLCPEGVLHLRMPAHEAFLRVLDETAAPVAFAATTAATVEQLLQTPGIEADCVLDAGATRFDKPATVVRVDGEVWTVLREGVLTAEDIARLSAVLVVFVCTGNTCRSPLAEALCKKLLAERLGCGTDELSTHGFLVQSAGIAAMIGGAATAEAVEVAREMGADLSGHASRPLSGRLALQADYLIGMTRSHVQTLAGVLPTGAPAPRLLSAAGDDLADPIGSDVQVYRDCAQAILRHLEALVGELHPS